MKVSYFSDTDSLYIELSERPSAESEEVAAGVVVDFDTEGRIVGIDVDQASKVLDLSRLDTESFPLQPAG